MGARAEVGMMQDERSAASDEPCPQSRPPGLPQNARPWYDLVVWHEALHLGQVTVARRAMGIPPLVDAPPQTEG